MPKSSPPTHTLVLLDAHAILHRAYHALPGFTSATGEPTGALYGLSLMVLSVIETLKPDYFAACYDLPKPTLRHDAYGEYKAGRAKADDALVAQLERSKALIDAFGIPRFEAEGYEADDLLGTIVEATRDTPDVRVIIASGDMDTLQLVEGERVQVFTLKKGIKDTVLYDEAKVSERFGFLPRLLPDYKGLRGDPSDNIPGVHGIGEKTAEKLVQTYGSLESLFIALANDPASLTSAGISTRMVALLKEARDEALFSRELATIRRDAPISFSLPKKPWRETVDVPSLLAFLHELGFRSLVPRVRALTGEAPKEAVEEQEKDVPNEAQVVETALALWLLESDRTSPTLDDIYEHTRTQSFDIARARILKELHERNLSKLYEDIELPLMGVIRDMERHGILIDREYLKKLSTRYRKELGELEAKIHTYAGRSFNINSPRQLGEILFDELHLAGGKTKRTTTGQRSTRETELQKLIGVHPIIDDILEYRELAKLLSTYIDALPELVGKDGRIHARFVQTGTTTGRISSQNPNLQNIPIRTTRGEAIRGAFVAPEGFVLLAADYSQIELRVAAFLSGDKKLIEIFSHGRDIHTEVAAEVFGVPPEHVDKEMRRRAKIINFGILYGMGVNALKENLGSSRDEAQRYLDEYFKRFSGITRYLDEVKAEVHRTGATHTFFGRRRQFEGIRSPLPYIVAATERMAINAPIQGTSADILKLAMVRMARACEERSLFDDVYMVLTVHDELVFEVRTSKLREVALLVRETMEQVMTREETRGVPLLVDIEYGPNWGELRKLTDQGDL